MVKVALISVALTGLAFLLLGVKVLFTKNGKFPSGHAHHNPRLRGKGIECHRDS